MSSQTSLSIQHIKIIENSKEFDVLIRFDFEIHVNISSDNFRPKKN